MSMTEILKQLPLLERSERERVWQRLEELELAEIEETPEMLKAIDAGRRSMAEVKSHSVDQAREAITRWVTKSS
jgi:hypothetical protein